MSTMQELEAKIAEQQSEIKFLRTILDSLPMPVYYKNRDSEFVYANESSPKHFGLNRVEELIGKTEFDFQPRGKTPCHFDIEQKLLRTQTPIIDLEEHIVDSLNGEDQWLLTNKFPVMENGKTLGFITSVVDVTSFKKQRSYAEEHNLLRQLIDNLPISIYVKDRVGYHITANQQQADICGIEKPEDLIGKHDREMYPDTWQEYHEDEQRIMATDKPMHNKEEHIIGQDGQDIWLLTTKVPTKDENGTVNGIIGFGVDITEMKLAQLDADRQRSIVEKQRQTLLDLSAPIIPITDDAIIMPLIGSFDGERAKVVMRSLLHGVSRFSANTVILDLTGVSMIDTEVAGYLHRSIEAIKLKGARAIITGITAEIAEAIIDLGIDWSKIETWRDLQSGINRILNHHT